MSWSRVWYRVSQFFRVWWGALHSVDIEYVRAKLGTGPYGAELLVLFSGMSRTEQHHGVHICRVLEQQGFGDRDLLAAALLHDVGKTVAPLCVWQRVLVVIVEHFAPRLAAEWADVPAGKPLSAGKPVPGGVRRGFVVRRYHAVWGAELAAQSGATPRTVAWIQQHHDPDCRQDPLLLALQDADEA